MPLKKEMLHQFEINPLSCGQAVLAMISGETQENIMKLVGTDKETKLSDMFFALGEFGIKIDKQRKPVSKKADLPNIALLSLQTPKCWHWSLYRNGKFYDPEYGVLDDFPPSNRRYFWEIFED